MRVLDTRLAGNDIKGLIGSSNIASAYAFKKIVQEIKLFVVGWGDSCLGRAISQMQVKEEETLPRGLGEPQRVGEHPYRNGHKSLKNICLRPGSILCCGKSEGLQASSDGHSTD